MLRLKVLKMFLCRKHFSVNVKYVQYCTLFCYNQLLKQRTKYNESPDNMFGAKDGSNNKNNKIYGLKNQIQA